METKERYKAEAGMFLTNARSLNNKMDATT